MILKKRKKKKEEKQHSNNPTKNYIEIMKKKTILL